MSAHFYTNKMQDILLGIKDILQFFLSAFVIFGVWTGENKLSQHIKLSQLLAQLNASLHVGPECTGPAADCHPSMLCPVQQVFTPVGDPQAI